MLNCTPESPDTSELMRIWAMSIRNQKNWNLKMPLNISSSISRIIHRVPKRSQIFLLNFRLLSNNHHIAFATALAFKLNPSELRFDQTIMRQHLKNCLLNGKMEAFPVISTRKNSNWRPRKQLSIDLNCICKMPFSEKDCGMPEKYRKVVQCLSCKIWYHPECESIPDTVVGDKNSLWFCSQCRARKGKRNSKQVISLSRLLFAMLSVNCAKYFLIVQ